MSKSINTSQLTNKGLVSSKEEQNFTDTEKKQARDNIDAVSQQELIDNKPKWADLPEIPNDKLPDRIRISGKVVTDWNTVKDNGFYHSANDATGLPSNFLDGTNTGIAIGLVISNTLDTTKIMQTIWQATSGRSWRRYGNQTGFDSWVELFSTSSEITSVIDPNYAKKVHTHTIEQVDGLRTQLDDIINNGRAYPRLVNGGDINFHDEVVTGTPTVVWGGSATAVKQYDPMNFAINNATQTELDLKITQGDADLTLTAITGALQETNISDSDVVVGHYQNEMRRWSWSTVKTWIKSWITKADVGLDKVANKSEADMVASGAIKTALDGKLTGSYVNLVGFGGTNGTNKEDPYFRHSDGEIIGMARRSQLDSKLDKSGGQMTGGLNGVSSNGSGMNGFFADTHGGSFADMRTRGASFSSWVNHSGSSYAPALKISYNSNNAYIGHWSVGVLNGQDANANSFAITHVNADGQLLWSWLYNPVSGNLELPAALTMTHGAFFNDGNSGGAKWEAWGSYYAFEAISAQIERRAQAWAVQEGRNQTGAYMIAEQFPIGCCVMGRVNHTSVNRGTWVGGDQIQLVSMLENGTGAYALNFSSNAGVGTWEALQGGSKSAVLTYKRRG